MTRICCILAILFALPLLSFCSDNPPPTLSVSGTAEVKVAPDIVEIDLGVDLRRDKLDDAYKANTERVAAVNKALTALGIPDKDIQSDYISINPTYRNNHETEVEYFHAQRSVRVTLHDVKNFDKILTAALEAGATTVQNVSFRTSELRKYRDQARVNAIKAAKEKAELLAKELGVKVGKPLNISEYANDGYYGYYGRSWRGGGGMMQNSVQNVSAGTTEGTLAPGQVGVSATVNVSFQIE